MNKIIVTRHRGVVAWLKRRGIVGEVIAHATPDEIRDRDVYGILPLHLAAEANSITVIDLPLLSTEQRGRDLNPIEMDNAGAKMIRYIVRGGDNDDG